MDLIQDSGTVGEMNIMAFLKVDSRVGFRSKESREYCVYKQRTIQISNVAHDINNNYIYNHK